MQVQCSKNQELASANPCVALEHPQRLRPKRQLTATTSSREALRAAVAFRVKTLNRYKKERLALCKLQLRPDVGSWRPKGWYAPFGLGACSGARLTRAREESYRVLEPPTRSMPCSPRGFLVGWHQRRDGEHQLRTRMEGDVWR